jgi:multicomponent Na+:H+ antiporter subunit G
MSLLAHTLVVALMLAGLFFFTGASVGILRFPDFYSRLHPAGKCDTMGMMLCMSAMALHIMMDWNLSAVLTGIKVILILLAVSLTSPTATHAIVDAGVRAGLSPWTKEPQVMEELR